MHTLSEGPVGMVLVVFFPCRVIAVDPGGHTAISQCHIARVVTCMRKGHIGDYQRDGGGEGTCEDHRTPRRAKLRGPYPFSARLLIEC